VDIEQLSTQIEQLVRSQELDDASADKEEGPQEERQNPKKA